MEKAEALDAVRNGTVHASAGMAAIQGDHLDHAIAQLDQARERLCEALSYVEQRREAQQEASH